MATVGQLLDGKYQLVRRLGAGGMATVFEATNTWTGRRVAIKTLQNSMLTNKTVVSRFWQEARSASLVQHPNIVNVLDMGFDETLEESFIVLEFLEGEDLSEKLAHSPGRRLPPEEALKYLLPIAQALMACHAARVLHRDIKPANIFLSRTPDGDILPKLIDFGITKIVGDAEEMRHTATGATLGTPAYMSREQAVGEKTIDERTDVWSLGVVLYEALCGALPYSATNAHQLIAKLIYEAPSPLTAHVEGLPVDLVTLVDHAVQPDRDFRMANMATFVERIRSCQSSLRDGTPALRLQAAPAPASRGLRTSQADGVPSSAPALDPAARHEGTAGQTSPRVVWRAMAFAGVVATLLLGGLVVMKLGTVRSHSGDAVASATPTPVPTTSIPTATAATISAEPSGSPHVDAPIATATIMNPHARQNLRGQRPRLAQTGSPTEAAAMRAAPSAPTEHALPMRAQPAPSSPVNSPSGATPSPRGGLATTVNMDPFGDSR